MASKSPRRKQLLESVGIEFKSIKPDFQEDYDQNLQGTQIPKVIVQKKADSLLEISHSQNLILVADTIVWFENSCLGKPKNLQITFQMLESLSGKTHQVITYVGFLFNKKLDTLSQITTVKFKDLEKKEILYYINRFSPLDKAGAYGIQDWIGLIGIEWIKGSYTNVVGLPLVEVVNQLKKYPLDLDF